MDFGALPPEINSGRMYTGPGVGPLMAAATTWGVLATELASALATYESTISGVAEVWLGSTSTSMLAATAPYLVWLRDTTFRVEQTAGQVRAAAAAYETAFTAIVPPAVVAANRAQLIQLVATNIFGQNTPAIAANEAAYAEMWAQDVAVMYGYAGASATATELAPFGAPPRITNPAGQTIQAAAATQAVDSSASAYAQSTLTPLLSAVPHHLAALSSAGLGTSAASPLDSSPVITGVSAFNTLTGPEANTAAFVRTGTNIVNMASALERSFAQGAKAIPAPHIAPHLTGASTVGLGAEGVSTPVLADVGRAAPVGQLSVPQSWTTIAPPVAAPANEPLWLSETALEGASTSDAAAPAATMLGGGPATGVGSMSGLLARPSVSSVLRVGPRRFRMPRPAVAG